MTSTSRIDRRLFWRDLLVEGLALDGHGRRLSAQPAPIARGSARDARADVTLRPSAQPAAPVAGAGWLDRWWRRGHRSRGRRGRGWGHRLTGRVRPRTMRWAGSARWGRGRRRGRGSGRWRRVLGGAAVASARPGAEPEVDRRHGLRGLRLGVEELALGEAEGPGDEDVGERGDRGVVVEDGRVVVLAREADLVLRRRQLLLEARGRSGWTSGPGSSPRPRTASAAWRSARSRRPRPAPRTLGAGGTALARASVTSVRTFCSKPM